MVLILFLSRYELLSRDNRAKSQVMQQRCAQRRELWPPPAPRTEVLPPRNWKLSTWTLSEAKEDLVLKPLNHQWPSSKVVQLKLALPVLLHMGSLTPYKPMEPWIREEDLGFLLISLFGCLLKINLSLLHTWCLSYWPYSVLGIQISGFNCNMVIYKKYSWAFRWPSTYFWYIFGLPLVVCGS